MFYTMYLSSVCQRRQWPSPLYEPYRTPSGHYCKVRVNNREYTTEVPYSSEALARDGAAQKAYMICRNFSVNDGMFPGQRSGSAIQGLPVAIGTGRGRTGSEGSSSSGGDSPRSEEEEGFESQQQVSMMMKSSSSSRRRKMDEDEDVYFCYCRRARVMRAYGRCGFCLGENGWA
ncbi:uncharacterized protein MYCFIDRAFT_214508 [Pseudocercospora fijiensis CIRAD86]|uniref:DRBM domain-containing protein n=1 Tax=Pseudocercospora fijiensis (strain CIRAD86) TaxID=383855 RepID=M3B346_PSEFD|nr:uncharacterized protein MYCFIDRAFT_214508 [Pseudocercospora fijiensis CIRAD86]EME83798.1 hypothetical protein MYCFIDRAFT_214508 [Pseudocercospora fijiensis CIRAD86]